MNRAQRTKLVEQAMGMTYDALNKLRGQAMVHRRAGNTTALAEVTAVINAAHAAKAAYVEANQLNPYTLTPAPASYERMQATQNKI